MVLQCRPRAIWRTYFQRDARLRHAMRWYTQMGRRVWPHEILGFLRHRLVKDGPTVTAFWGAPQDGEEESMSAAQRERSADARDAAWHRVAGGIDVPGAMQASYSVLPPL